MADWKTVRFDPSWPEPLDEEIVTLCDSLNAAGFVTTTSCSGHGGWPNVWFEHSSDEVIEELARFVMEHEKGGAHFTQWKKEIRPDSYLWQITVHMNNVYHDTPAEVVKVAATKACNATAHAIDQWTARKESK
jgi:hypothetical protein